MEMVLIGLLGGFLVGLAIGWIGGRLAGIREGQYRERRRLEHLGAVPGAPGHHPSPRGFAMDRPELQVDSMAEFADPAPRPRMVAPPAPQPPRALGPGGPPRGGR